ncbi:hypothetical protein [Maribacter arenosus]|uniref:Uncharacterized protein n=1 Tax=Maribacter arenosus TaxID=1854708 RepID=A0ABR7VCN3_9FLAO|nr:hypothetical protein [Maribacter arenosus]MBD0851425.1 hypothetical protein [Maribacter arenosus]
MKPTLDYTAKVTSKEQLNSLPFIMTPRLDVFDDAIEEMLQNTPEKLEAGLENEDKDWYGCI